MPDQQNQYCYYCEDGGELIDCSNIRCTKAFCYEVLGQTNNGEDAPEKQPCVTIPAEMNTDRSRSFQCPECLKDDPPATMKVSVAALIASVHLLSVT